MPFSSFLRAPKIGFAAVGIAALGLGTASPALAAPGHNAAATPSAIVANNTLTITGTDGSDSVQIELAADPNQLVVDLGAAGVQSFDRTTFTSIAVFLRGGDDKFNEIDPAPTQTLTVDGGSGNDEIQTGSGNDLVFGGDGNDIIRTGAGDDVIDAGKGDDTVTGGLGHDTAFLAAGHDTFVWLPGDGSDFVDGGGGNDALNFVGAAGNEIMSLSSNEGRAVFLRNLGNIRMDLDSIETVNVAALGGTDQITVNDTSGTDVRDVNVDLAGPLGTPDGAVDTVIVNGTAGNDRVKVDTDSGAVNVQGLNPETHITNSDPTDQLQVNTLDGNDRVNVDPSVGPVITTGVDLGAGQH